MWFALYVWKKGIITSDQFARAIEEQQSRRPLLGSLAVQKKYLTVKQVMRVLSDQADEPETPFGELAVKLGFLSKEQLDRLLVEQNESVPDLCYILVEIGALVRQKMLHQLQMARNDLSTSALNEVVRA